jgi:hypothetical protein
MQSTSPPQRIAVSPLAPPPKMLNTFTVIMIMFLTPRFERYSWTRSPYMDSEQDGQKTSPFFPQSIQKRAD